MPDKNAEIEADRFSDATPEPLRGVWSPDRFRALHGIRAAEGKSPADEAHRSGGGLPRPASGSREEAGA
ncbi:MAG: hypothetical protein AB1425_09250 [Actinomycetota bacterium]